MVMCLVNYELERIWKEAVVAQEWYLPREAMSKMQFEGRMQTFLPVQYGPRSNFRSMKRKIRNSMNNYLIRIYAKILFIKMFCLLTV